MELFIYSLPCIYFTVTKKATHSITFSYYLQEWYVWGNRNFFASIN